jgi:hypothetical protein
MAPSCPPRPPSSIRRSSIARCSVAHASSTEFHICFAVLPTSIPVWEGGELWFEEHESVKVGLVDYTHLSTALLRF